MISDVGEILQTGTIHETDFGLLSGNIIEGKAYDINKQYIPDPLNPVFTDKVTNPIHLDKISVIADGVDVITLSNVPEGTEIDITGNGVNALETLQSPSDTLTFDTAGTYTLSIYKFPYLSWVRIINVT